MKRVLFALPIIAAVFLIFTGQNVKDNPQDNQKQIAETDQFNRLKWNIDPRMTRMYPTGDYTPLPYNDKSKTFSSEVRIVGTPNEVLSVSPNFMVHPSFSAQSETPITRHPFNPNMMLASANTYRGGNFFTVGVYVTTDGGTTWFGSDTINTGTPNYGDPGPAIDKDGRFYMSFIMTTGNMGASYSTDLGITWAPTVTIPGSSTSSDKNFSTTDDIPLSAYYGRAYTVYTEFAGAFSNRIVLSYSSNGGVNWSNINGVSPLPAGAHYHQGADVKVNQNGEVYVTWADNFTSTAIEDHLGFAKSSDGGVSWYYANNEVSDMDGIRANSFAPFGIRVNGFPRLDIDKTNGPRRGWIYAVTSEKFLSPATDYADIVLHRSTNGGLNWTKVRVNQDTPGNGKAQFMAAVNVDEQGGVNVIYYDTRNSNANDSAQIYVSRSVDGGSTFQDILVSDHKFRPKSINGLAAGYQGDYIGITSGNGYLWPYWCDDISGIYQAWTASVGINLGPLSNFNLTSPAAGTTITTYSNSQDNIILNWDTASATANYKWIFGSPTISPRKLTIPTPTNFLTLTSDQFDNLLAGLGLAVGDSLVGQWDVWAFRNNLTQDSLKALNGPRAITLKRGIPPLRPFNLISPVAGTVINTSAYNTVNVNFNWSTSGPGVKYKWKFGSPTISNSVKLTYTSNITGIDSSFTIPNYSLDAALASIGVSPGDSISGEWSVWAYNNFDSVKATQNFALKFKRQAQANVLVLYDSTLANCRISRDSVITNLNRLNYTCDTYNRKGNAATNSISFRGYKYVFVVGEASSVMSNVIKDSIKTYLASGGTGTLKSKLVIMSEDVGYHLDRPNSAYYDSAFARTTLGFSFVADRPGVGGKDITGVTVSPGLTDSTYGPSPDVIAKSASIPSAQTFILYKYTAYTDSMNSIGRINTNYNTAVLASDAESIRSSYLSPTSFPLKRVIYGLMQFVNEVPTSNDPEYTAGNIPLVYSLSQNYPNPFNPSTKISFSLPVSGLVTLKIYDMLGQEVMNAVNEVKEAGKYEVEINAGYLASGMYFYKLNSGEFTETRKMLLLK